MAIVNAATATVQLSQVDCGNCGGSYAISERYRKQMQEDAGTWHCPYCRTCWGYAEGDLDELRKQLELEKKRTEWARQDADRAKAQAQRAEHSRRSEKAAKTRIKNRIAHGVCPCCKRYFENVERHMKSKHPEFSKGDA